MNAATRSDQQPTADLDPLDSLNIDVSAVAEIAMGRGRSATEVGAGRHLALLTAESLELDLSDPAQRQFGDYELTELIGEGGMGVVYRAHQKSLDREVAVKLLAAGPWASRDFIERFRREAQNAARMQHPNIVTIHEVGSAEELHFFSMRLIHGPSLAAELKREGRLAPRRAAALVRTIAEAVDYAHRLGVLHLDLKPANVLLDESGVPHVADFGLARRIDSALAAGGDEISGTPSYMAPEQASPRTARITTATDIWGLGAILYELITGSPPFLADSAQGTLRLVLDGNVRGPRQLAADIPPDLEAITLKCLARESGERYTSARALADDLAAFVEGRPVRARPLNGVQRVARWARRQPYVATFALLFALSLVAGIVGVTQQWHRAEGNAAAARANLWNARDDAALKLIESGDGWHAMPQLLANLAEAESVHDAGRASAARKRIGMIENANPKLIDVLPVRTGTRVLAFSPDGQKLAAGAIDSGLSLFDVASGKELLRTLAFDQNRPGTGINIQRITFSPDSTLLHVSTFRAPPFMPIPGYSRMLQFDLATGTWRQPPFESKDKFDSHASFADDGRHAVLTDNDGRSQFWETNPWRAVSPLHALPGQLSGEPAMIAPNGAFFAVTPQGGDGLHLFDSRTLAEWPRIDLGTFAHIQSWAFSPDSHWLALGDDEGHVAVLDSLTRDVRRPEPGSYLPVRWLAFSDDGQWLAAAGDAAGTYVWNWPQARLLAPPFGGNPLRGGSSTASYVSPDRAHNRLLVGGNMEAKAAVWQIAPTPFGADRSEAAQVTARVDAYGDSGSESIGVAWLPEQGLAASVSDRKIRLERMPVPAFKDVQGAPVAPGMLRFDGQRLVAVSGHSVQLVDALSQAPLGAAFEFTQPPAFAELTPDGSALVVASGRLLHVIDVASHRARFAPIELTNSPQRVEIGPDSRRIVTTWLSRDESEGARETAEIWDSADGHRVAGPTPLPGPLFSLRFSDDGAQLLAWNRDELALRDAQTLAPVVAGLGDLHMPSKFKNEAHEHLLAAAFDGAGGIWTSTQRYASVAPPDPTSVYQWLHYPRGTAQASPVAGWDRVDNFVALPRSHATLVVPDQTPWTVLDADGTRHVLPMNIDDSPRMEVAVSRDGRWLAGIGRDGVILADLEQLARVAILRTALQRPDFVTQVAFSPDGNRLLARTLRNRYIVWNLDPDLRPVAAIARELDLREVPQSVVAGDSHDPDASERATLRAADPGPPPQPSLSAPLSARTLPGGAIAPRDPATPAELLDLTPYYNFGLGETCRTSELAGDFAWLPQGVRRLFGVDYDIRGGIDLWGTGAPRDAADFAAARSVTLPLGQRRLAAVDALMLLYLPAPEPEDAIATVRFAYADGTQDSQPVRRKQDVEGFIKQNRLGVEAQLAAIGHDARTDLLRNGAPVRAYAVHVPDPHPERPVTTITIAAIDGVSEVLFAVTIEPFSAAPDAARDASP